MAFQVVVKFDESNAQRPHSLGFKALSRQYTVPHIFLEIPEVGRAGVRHSIITAAAQPGARNTPMPLQGETQHFKWFVAGDPSVFLFSTTKRLCIRHLRKIREDKWLMIYLKLLEEELYFCWSKEFWNVTKICCAFVWKLTTHYGFTVFHTLNLMWNLLHTWHRMSHCKSEPNWHITSSHHPVCACCKSLILKGSEGSTTVLNYNKLHSFKST